MIHIKHARFLRRRDSQGFTIIEVSLFLAISGLLLIIVLFGMGSSQRNAQFRDAMQSTGDFLNQQVNAIQGSVHTSSGETDCIFDGSIGMMKTSSGSGGKAGTNQDCILLGRIYYFGEENISGYDVVGARDSKIVTGACNSATAKAMAGISILDDIRSLCPTAQDTDVSPAVNTAPSYSYKWGSILEDNARRNSSTKGPFKSTAPSGVAYESVEAVGILLNPDNGTTINAVFGDDTSGSLKVLAVNSDINTQLCFRGVASYDGAIYLGGQYESGDDTTQGTTNLFNVKIDDNTCPTS